MFPFIVKNFKSKREISLLKQIYTKNAHIRALEVEIERLNILIEKNHILYSKELLW